MTPFTRPFRLAPALLALANALAPGAAGAAPPSPPGPPPLVVVSGEVRVEGGEEACFTLEGGTLAEERLRVRIHFKGVVPRGRVLVDDASSDELVMASEEFAFRVARAGTHRLALHLEEPGTVDRLEVVATEARPVPSACAAYVEEERQRHLATPREEPPPPPPPVDRFERNPPPPPPAPAAVEETWSATRPAARLSAGTELVLTLDDEISTRTAHAGKRFGTHLSEPVVSAGVVVIPAGTRVLGQVSESQDAGRFGRSKLTLAFDRAVLPDGTELPLLASLRRLGQGSGKKQGGIIAGSAAGGALLGQILGGSSEATALGAIIGGSIAAGSIAAKPGEPVTLPAGTILAVALDASADVPAAVPAVTPRR
jgi:hypothetical protein